MFVITCHGDVLRRMAILTRRLGLVPEGEYAFIFFFELEGSPPLGKYDWRRGDALDPVRNEYLQFI